MAMSNLFSIAECLKEITVSADMTKILTEDASMWNMFGKKDSHLLRAKLFKLMAEKKLNTEAKFVVFFFFSVIKNRNRVMASFDELPDNIKSLPSVSQAKEFISTVIVQYTSQESSKKFAAVHLPTTMPGLDLMLTALLTNDHKDEIEKNIIAKQTFAQINVDATLQSTNKSHQQVFWNSVVQSSKNEARINKTVTEELKFNESYYNTSASDKYLLVDLDMKEIAPQNATTGYTLEEIHKWVTLVKSQQKKMMGTAAKKPST